MDFSYKNRKLDAKKHMASHHVGKLKQTSFSTVVETFFAFDVSN